MSGPRHDALLVDLDGTVYRGPDAIDGAVESLTEARSSARVSYVTNNASRGPDEVAEQLRGLGLTLDTADVVTSAQAAAGVLAERCEAGAAVLVVGTEALAHEVREVGLTPVRSEDDQPVAVVQGHSPDTGWRILAEATLAVRRGALWVACNVDPTLPNERGMMPGNGSMVAALRTATDREPVVAGKPAAPLMRQAIERAGARNPLTVGDRLDTDIAGGHAVDAETLLVLTGVSTAGEVLAAPADQRPTYLAADLRCLQDGGAALASAHVLDGDAGGWTVRREDGALVLAGEGDDRFAALRALCRQAWADDAGPAEIRADGPDAREVVEALGLASR